MHSMLFGIIKSSLNYSKYYFIHLVKNYILALCIKLLVLN
ncbi:hypothetical protein A1OE_1448 [Candidatus Endolissoclinum faulkneri L2]|uniref:Uncharacterized protein n=1 Tax=Candidatus Endolissoclinum faulkneri L2 TaxID=1193729 RepID=K7YPZ1_9PROT|nr:hypothetical protein A1OE_1448 [Candidatus Endolissoclinum faulkneri L2]